MRIRRELPLGAARRQIDPTPAKWGTYLGPNFKDTGVKGLDDLIFPETGPSLNQQNQSVERAPCPMPLFSVESE